MATRSVVRSPAAEPSRPPTAAPASPAQDLHDAVVALEGAPDAPPRESRRLVGDVVAAASALDHATPPRHRKLKNVEKRILHDLNNEAFTITTVADFVATAIPDGQSHDDAVELYEAGTRVAAVAVRLQDHLETSEPPATPPPNA